MIKQVDPYVIDQSNEHPDGDVEQIELNKDEPYIMALTSYRYEFAKIKNISKDLQFIKLTKIIKLLHIEWDYQNPV